MYPLWTREVERLLQSFHRPWLTIRRNEMCPPGQIKSSSDESLFQHPSGIPDPNLLASLFPMLCAHFEWRISGLPVCGP